MRYLSVCSGIEAASVAWHPLGFQPVGFSEIDRFPCEVLAARYGSNLPGEPLSHNAPPNLGDMTKFQEWPDYAIDLLVGGTPCQSFSVAGLRHGLADPRGNLALTYLGIADRYRPKWVLWENVPGVLSSNAGRDFGAFLGALVQLGYGFAYRVLDAQYVRIDGFGRAVPQRRRRVFVVGCSAGWRHAAAVLFDGASLRGDSAPSREAGKGIAPTISARTKGGGGLGTDFDCDGGLIAHAFAFDMRGRDGGAMPEGQHETTNIRAASGGSSRSYVVFAQNQRDEVRLMSIAGALSADPGMKQQTYIAHAIQAGALRENPESGPDGIGVQADLAYTLEARAEVQAVHHHWAVRRLTPTECERLQGFPDGWTDIARPNGKQAADGPRYTALGNSMAVNVMRWIGRRIEMVDSISKQLNN